MVELFPLQPAETVQTPDRLLAAHAAREWSNSWIMEGRGKSQTLEPMQASSGAGEGVEGQKTAAGMSFSPTAAFLSPCFFHS